MKLIDYEELKGLEVKGRADRAEDKRPEARGQENRSLIKLIDKQSVQYLYSVILF